jgi:hypothetical protein
MTFKRRKKNRGGQNNLIMFQTAHKISCSRQLMVVVGGNVSVPFMNYARRSWLRYLDSCHSDGGNTAQGGANCSGGGAAQLIEHHEQVAVVAAQLREQQEREAASAQAATVNVMTDVTGVVAEDTPPGRPGNAC